MGYQEDLKAQMEKLKPQPVAQQNTPKTTDNNYSSQLLAQMEKLRPTQQTTPQVTNTTNTTNKNVAIATPTYRSHAGVAQKADNSKAQQRATMTKQTPVNTDLEVVEIPSTQASAGDTVINTNNTGTPNREGFLYQVGQFADTLGAIGKGTVANVAKGLNALDVLANKIALNDTTTIDAKALYDYAKGSRDIGNELAWNVFQGIATNRDDPKLKDLYLDISNAKLNGREWQGTEEDIKNILTNSQTDYAANRYNKWVQPNVENYEEHMQEMEKTHGKDVVDFLRPGIEFDAAIVPFGLTKGLGASTTASMGFSGAIQGSNKMQQYMENGKDYGEASQNIPIEVAKNIAFGKILEVAQPILSSGISPDAGLLANFARASVNGLGVGTLAATTTQAFDLLKDDPDYDYIDWNKVENGIKSGKYQSLEDYTNSDEFTKDVMGSRAKQIAISAAMTALYNGISQTSAAYKAGKAATAQQKAEQQTLENNANKYLKELNLKEGATRDEIKAAYRTLSKQYHPDLHPENEDKFKAINEAYNELTKNQNYSFIFGETPTQTTQPTQTPVDTSQAVASDMALVPQTQTPVNTNVGASQVIANSIPTTNNTLVQQPTQTTQPVQEVNAAVPAISNAPQQIENSNQGSFSIPEDVEKYIFDKDFYEPYQYEDKSKITETLDELQNQKALAVQQGNDDIYDINAKIKAVSKGYDNLYDYYVGEAKRRIAEEYRDNPKSIQRKIDEKKALEQKEKQLQKEINEATPFKKAQYELIQKTNPAPNDTLTWIRTPADIKTFEEVINEDEGFGWGDYSKEDALRDLARNKVTVYSSYPIKNGVFVSTSLQQAKDYAGGGKVYSKEISPNKIAWINGDEGQYASVSVDNTSQNNMLPSNEELQQGTNKSIEEGTKALGLEKEEPVKPSKVLKEKDIKQVIDKNVGLEPGNSKVVRETVKAMNEDIAYGNLTDEKLEEYVDKLGNTLRSSDTTYYDMYKDLKQDIKKYKIYVPDNIKRGITDYNDFRKANYGNLTLTSNPSNMGVDQVWQELRETYPEMLPEDTINPIDQLETLADISNGIRIKKSNLRDALENQFGRSAWDEVAALLKDEFAGLRDKPESTFKLTDKQVKAVENYLHELFNDNTLPEEFKDSLYDRFKTIDSYQQLKDIKNEVDTYKEAGKHMAEAEQYDDIPDPKVAELVKQRPERQKMTKKQQLENAYKTLVNKGYYIDKLADVSGNQELKYKYDKMLSSTNEGNYVVGEKQTDNKGNPIGKSVNEIWKPVEDAGKVQEFSEYLLHKLNVDRMSLEDPDALIAAEEHFDWYAKSHPDIANMPQSKIIKLANSDEPNAEIAKKYLELDRQVDILENRKNKPVFGETVTADDSRKAIAEIEKNNPEFVEWAKDVNTFNKNQLQNMVDSGLASKETQELLNSMYDNYIRIQRDVGGDSPIVNQKGRLKVNSPIKKAQGGSSDILPLKDSMAQQAVEVKKAIARNEFGKELLNTLKNGEEVEDYGEVLEPGKNGEAPTFTVFVDGKPVTMKINDDLYDAIKPSERASWEDSVIARGLQKAVVMQKTLLTSRNPIFAFTNFVRDLQTAVVNSKDTPKMLNNYKKLAQYKFAELYSKATGKEMSEANEELGRLWDLYKANGGESNTYFDFEKGTDLDEKNPIKRGINKTIDKVFALNEIIEQLPRVSEFITTIENGGSIDEAMYNAADVTVNFKRGGDMAKMLDRNGASFLNASIQGLDKQIRNVTDAFKSKNKGKAFANLVLKAALIGIGPALLNHLLLSEDEDYQDLPNYIKDNYWLIKTGDDTFLRIPRGRDIPTFLGDIAQRTARAIKGEENAFEGLVDTFNNSLAPNNPVENNVFAPLIAMSTNKSWNGSNIVSSSLQNKVPEQQYDAKDTEFAKWLAGTDLGKALGASPKKIDYLLDQYSGAIGDFLIPMNTKYAEEKGPLSSKFMTDSVKNNKNVSQFYDTKDELAKKKSSGVATDEEIFQAAYLNKINDEVSDLYKSMRETESSNLPDKEKIKLTTEDQKKINELTKKANNTMKDYGKAGAEYYNAYNEVLDSDIYKNESPSRQSEMNDSIKERVINDANLITKGKFGLTSQKEEGSLKNLKEKINAVEEANIPLADYYIAWEAQKDAQSEKNGNGTTISYSKARNQKKLIDEVLGDDLSQEQLEVLYGVFDISKKVY